MPRRKTDTREGEEQQASIEGNFIQLEEIMEELEAGDSALEESFACYEAGMRLMKPLNSQIDKIEKKIQILSEGDENE